MTDDEKKIIQEGFTVFAADIASHKAALDRLAANLTAEHATIVELAEIVNRHTEILESLRLAVEAKLGKPPSEPAVN